VDFLKEANSIIAAEYKTVEAEIGMVRQDQTQLNQQIDALISSFNQLDAIEADISQTEANIELIGKTVNRISTPLPMQTSA
jgi:septal ring factor EnvC (AmiA/AmiB activator)